MFSSASGAQAPPAVKDVEGAKQYLSRNSVHMLFETLASSVINEQPEDPVLHCYVTLGGMLSPEAQEKVAQGGARSPAEESNEKQNTSNKTCDNKDDVSKSGAGDTAGSQNSSLPSVLFVLPTSTSGGTPPTSPSKSQFDVKSEITDRLASEKDAVVTATLGDLLRAEAARGGILGEQVNALLVREKEANQLLLSKDESAGSASQQEAQAALQTTGSLVPGRLCLDIITPWLKQQPRTTFEGQQVTVVIHDFPRSILDAVAIQQLVGGLPSSCFARHHHDGPVETSNKNKFAKVKGVVSFTTTRSSSSTPQQQQSDDSTDLVDYFTAWDTETLTSINLTPKGKEAQQVATQRGYNKFCKLLGLHSASAVEEEPSQEEDGDETRPKEEKKVPTTEDPSAASKGENEEEPKDAAQQQPSTKEEEEERGFRALPPADEKERISATEAETPAPPPQVATESDDKPSTD